jgi:hypothetical protein
MRISPGALGFRVD